MDLRPRTIFICDKCEKEILAIADCMARRTHKKFDLCFDCYFAWQEEPTKKWKKDILEEPQESPEKKISWEYDPKTGEEQQTLIPKEPKSDKGEFIGDLFSYDE